MVCHFGAGLPLALPVRMNPQARIPLSATTTDDTHGPPLPVAGPDDYCLQILFSPDGESSGAVIGLPQRTTNIGRGELGAHSVRIADKKLSRSHASVMWCSTRQGFLLVDLNSRNGTSLNGAATRREVLRPGDIIRAGNTVLRFVTRQQVAGESTEEGDSLLVGRSVALHTLMEHITRAAPSSISVLLLGETGTGKELAARTLHQRSGRTGPFRAINCAAIAPELITAELFGHTKGAFSGAESAREGLFRSANGGTVFLDEVGELSGEQQAKLLRVLDTQRVLPVGASAEVGIDVRVVAATNQDLAARVDAGEFRADLYARLAGWVVRLAPLRERPDDLQPLLEHFLAEASDARYSVRGDFFEALALHRWPFNVRELRSLVQRLTLLVPNGGPITASLLPDEFAAVRRSGQRSVELPPPRIEPTPEELRRLAEELRGNVKAMAEFAGKGREQIYRWMRRYNIDPNAYRRR